MRRKLNITVSGEFCSGKSHVTYLIKKTLKENGFDVEFEPDLDYGPMEGDFDNRIGRHNSEAITQLATDTKIKIEQRQLKREIL